MFGFHTPRTYGSFESIRGTLQYQYLAAYLELLRTAAESGSARSEKAKALLDKYRRCGANVKRSSSNPLIMCNEY
jgi:hypothetical protein